MADSKIAGQKKKLERDGWVFNVNRPAGKHVDSTGKVVEMAPLHGAYKFADNGHKVEKLHHSEEALLADIEEWELANDPDDPVRR